LDLSKQSFNDPLGRINKDIMEIWFRGFVGRTDSTISVRNMAMATVTRWRELIKYNGYKTLETNFSHILPRILTEYEMV